MATPSDIHVRPAQYAQEMKCMNCATPFRVLIFDLGTLRVRLCQECLAAVSRGAAQHRK